MLRLRKVFVSLAVATVLAVFSLALVPSVPTFASNTYPYGQCTYYAKMMRPDIGNHWGDAKYWATSARRAGFAVSSWPQVGDVAAFGAYVQGDSRYGHVGIVRKVSGSWFVISSMWGNEANGRIHWTWHYVGAGVQFIHYRKW